MRSLPAAVAPLAAAIAAVTAAVAARTAAFSLGTGFVDVERTTVELRAVQSGNGAIGFVVDAHLYEAEASRATGVAIGDYADPVDCPVRFKNGSDCVFGSSEAQISYENVFHLNLLSAIYRAANRGQDRRGKPGYASGQN